MSMQPFFGTRERPNAYPLRMFRLRQGTEGPGHGRRGHRSLPLVPGDHGRPIFPARSIFRGGAIFPARGISLDRAAAASASLAPARRAPGAAIFGRIGGIRGDPPDGPGGPGIRRDDRAA